jgi:hypothetical protein
VFFIALTFYINQAKTQKYVGSLLAGIVLKARTSTSEPSGDIAARPCVSLPGTGMGAPVPMRATPLLTHRPVSGDTLYTKVAPCVSLLLPKLKPRVSPL